MNLQGVTHIFLLAMFVFFSVTALYMSVCMVVALYMAHIEDKQFREKAEKYKYKDEIARKIVAVRNTLDTDNPLSPERRAHLELILRGMERAHARLSDV